MSAAGPRRGAWLFPSVAAPRLVDAFVAAEHGGLDELWLGDEGPARDPFPLLAAAAMCTSRITLGIAVTNAYLRHPMVTAAEMMTVHELSGGRSILGLGPGGRVALGPAGVERTAPLSTARAALRTMRAVTTGRSEHGYDAPAHPFTAPDLPLYIGSRGEQFNRLASAEADGVFLGGIPASMIDEAIGWARSCRPIAVSLYYAAAFGTDEAEAFRAQMAYVIADSPAATRAHLGIDTAALERATAALLDGDDTPARALVDDRVLHDILLVGSPETIGVEMARRARAHAPQSIGLTFANDEPEASIESTLATFHAFDKELGE
jgi:5,10-methylenetetrahydromethanopterin reductase